MTTYNETTQAKQREEYLRFLFIEKSEWPVDRASFSALIDMGMTESRIAKYFSVDRTDVYRLREFYEKPATRTQ